VKTAWLDDVEFRCRDTRHRPVFIAVVPVRAGRVSDGFLRLLALEPSLTLPARTTTRISVSPTHSGVNEHAAQASEFTCLRCVLGPTVKCLKCSTLPSSPVKKTQHLSCLSLDYS
jgi:hypothetical protein